MGAVSAIELPESQLELELQSIKTSGTDFIRSYSSDQEDWDEFDIDAEDDGSIFEYEYKSPKKAFLYSLLIPGWGQKYAGSSFWKPLLFFGAEVGSWVGYFSYHNEGEKLTDDYQAFAGEHWSEGDRNPASHVPDSTTYWDWVRDQEIIPREHLPESKTQQYYEMIGKYNEFAGGWDDFWTIQQNIDAGFDPSHDDIVLLTPHRQIYNNLRGRANDKLDMANKFIIVAMANHLISAFDAALAANRFNKGKTEESWLSVNAELMKYSATDEIPILKFTYHFK
jgi:uncharacterized protein DUF5683